MNVNFPTGLKHVMEVYRLVRQSHRSRIKAVNEIAHKQRIDPQTVTSACTRSLGIGTSDFDYFLLPHRSEAFCDHLVKRYPPYQKHIEAFFVEFDGRRDNTEEDPISLVRTLFPNEKNDLLRLLLLHNISKKLLIWSTQNDIPENIRREMVETKKQIDEA